MPRPTQPKACALSCLRSHDYDARPWPNITVMGTNYVGLVTACFAELGNQVIGVEIDPQKVARLQRGQIPMFEPGWRKSSSRISEHHASASRWTTSTAPSWLNSPSCPLARPRERK